MLAYLFPGQGSQKKGMGQGQFDRVREFRDIESQIDAVLGFSVRDVCLNDPDGRLKDTRYTQPCLFITNALHYYEAVASGGQPRFLAGHSLGEYNALLAAGAFDLLTGVKLVNERARLMAQARSGGMAAVIGLGSARIADVLRDSGLSAIDVANYNAPEQTVISGVQTDLQRAQPFFERAGATMYIPLQVSAAFHSRYMADAASAFGEFLNKFQFNPLKTPVMANTTGELYPAQDPDAFIKATLTKQITHSVQWVKGIHALKRAGVTEFKEVGPGNVLTRLTQQISKEWLH